MTQVKSSQSNAFLFYPQRTCRDTGGPLWTDSPNTSENLELEENRKQKKKSRILLYFIRNDDWHIVSSINIDYYSWIIDESHWTLPFEQQEGITYGHLRPFRECELSWEITEVYNKEGAWSDLHFGAIILTSVEWWI